MDYQITPKNPTEFDALHIAELSHNYHAHPLFQLDALEALAEKLLPTGQCRFPEHPLELDSDFQHADKPADNRSIAEIFDQLDQPGSWIALYNVETDPLYNSLLVSILDDLKQYVHETQGRHFNVGGFIFITSAPAFTPFHIDRENNFWLQIKGQKHMHLFDNRNRDVVKEEELESFIVRRGQPSFRPTAENRQFSREFQMSPGNGVYFPSTTPHMTETRELPGESPTNVSVSIGIVFYTDHTRHIARVYQCNKLLRKLGFSPAPPSGKGIQDSIKAGIGILFTWFNKTFRNYSPPPGAY